MDIFEAGLIFWFTLFGPGRKVGQRRDATWAPTPGQTIPCRGWAAAIPGLKMGWQEALNPGSARAGPRS